MAAHDFTSFFELLVELDFPFANQIDAWLYPEEHARVKPKELGHIKAGSKPRRWNPHPAANWFESTLQQWRGAFQPLTHILKDIVETVKPYKSWSHYMLRDVLQPVRGLLNIAAGIASLAGSVVLLLVFTLVGIARLGMAALREDPSSSKDFSSSFYWFTRMLEDVLLGGSLVVNNILRILRGITQVAMTPLLPAKIFLRLTITLYKGRPKIEDNPGIQRVAQMGLTALANLANVSKDENQDQKEEKLLNAAWHALERVHEQYQKEFNRGQEAKTSSHETSLFNNASAYLKGWKAQKTNPLEQTEKYFALFVNPTQRARNEPSKSQEELSAVRLK